MGVLRLVFEERPQSLPRFRAVLQESGLLAYRISLQGCKPLCDQNVAVFAEAMPLAVQDVDLDFSSCSVGDAAATAVGLAMKNRTELRVLNLNFKSTVITDVGVQALGDGISELTKLTSLDLSFYDTSVADFGLQALANKISKLPHITSINLWLHDTAIGDVGLQALVESFANSQVEVQVNGQQFKTMVAKHTLSYGKWKERVDKVQKDR